MTDDYKRTNRFDEPTKAFARRYSLMGFFFGRFLYRKLLKNLNLTGNERILDFGSGVGSLAKIILKKIQPNGHYTCLDVSSVLIDEAKRKLKPFKNVDFIVSDIRESKLESNSYDLIVSSWVIHHVPKEVRLESMKYLYKILKPNGRTLIQEFSGDNHGIPEDEIMKLFADAGFSGKKLTHKRMGAVFEFIKK
ncbi:MAG: class I SAM-dependent methyltransferase [Candidatus Heimdallarchaeota archaeon]